MLDIKLIKENKDLIIKNNQYRRVKVDIDKLLKIYDERNQLLQDIEDRRKTRKLQSKTKPTPEVAKQMKALGQAIKLLEDKLKKIARQYQDLIYKIPNLTDPSVPLGKDESDNRTIKTVGRIPKFDFQVKDHIHLGKELDIIDVEKATEISGARFYYLKNEAVLIQFALIQYVLKTLTDKDLMAKIAKSVKNPSDKTFIPMVVPVMIKPEVFAKMGRLEPVEDKYYIPNDDLYLTGSAEHTLGPLHMNEVLDIKDLPIRYLGYSTAFRREAGSYGKDVKGILRTHQFDKLEIESFTSEENGRLEQDFIVALQEYLVNSLEIPYQVVSISTGDMGVPDYRQIDIECWIPSQNKYRETHTSDYITDYQSRRLNAKYKDNDGQNKYLYMNDATVFAIGRILIAILENYQTKQGTVKVPKVLQPYLDFKEIKRK